MPRSETLARAAVDFRALAIEARDLSRTALLPPGASGNAETALNDLARECENRAGAALVKEFKQRSESGR